jgi:RNA polymerase sigma factor (sigma-70 family)
VNQADLAQETFVAAWKQLRDLREPVKLRPWLCGIARHLTHNWLRRQGREPVHAAETLAAAVESPAPEPLPPDQVISKEEETILWRSLERIPEVYREPLVLFYREHRSVENVAQALELSEDAVKQRLSRGRKLLHEQVLAFVEGALERTNPGKAFTIGVLAVAGPHFIRAGGGCRRDAAKGSATAKAAAATGVFSGLLGPALGFFATWMGYRMSLDAARTETERKLTRMFYRKLTGCLIGFGVAFVVLIFSGGSLIRNRPGLFVALVIGLGLAYVAAIAALSVWSFRVRKRLAREKQRQEPVDTARPGI